LTSLRDEIAVGSELASTGITFVSPAAPATRADLSVPVAGVLGLIIGLIIGSVIARWMALRERRLSDYAEPGRILAAPLLADVPDFSSERLTSPIPVRDHSASATAETFRFAASNMAVRLKALDMKCVSVVSGTVGDGKSTVAANLGYAATGLGSDGSRVLLSDADFSDQTLTSMLGVPLDSAGLTEVAISNAPLSFAAQALAWTGPGQIFLLPRGDLPVDTQSFFWSDDVRRVIEEAREDFDLVIIDTPPLLQVAYAGNLARLADSSVVVARHRGNSAELAEVRDRLTLLARQSIGYVYNKAPMRGWMSEDARPAARGKTDLGLAIDRDVNR
jgi:Mrp family chromosome partitioning ATPase